MAVEYQRVTLDIPAAYWARLTVRARQRHETVTEYILQETLTLARSRGRGRKPPVAETAFTRELDAAISLRGVSFNQAGRDAGIDPSYVSRLVRGEREPTRAVIVALAKALDLDVDGTAGLLNSAGYLAEVPQ